MELELRQLSPPHPPQVNSTSRFCSRGRGTSRRCPVHDLPATDSNELHLVVPLASILHLVQLPGRASGPPRGPGDHRKLPPWELPLSVICSHGWAGRLQDGRGQDRERPACRDERKEQGNPRVLSPLHSPA